MLNPIVEAAAHGVLPAWSQVSPRRRAHMERVADQLGSWAQALALSATDALRWRAAGLLHDALRDAPALLLRPLVPPALQDIPDKLLHGPAAAEKLRQDGVDDAALLHAVAYHTIGHAELDRLGRALFIADYIEPGRNYEPARLAVMRARMPAAFDGVLRAVLRARIERLLIEGRPIRSETAAFWNAISSHGHGAARPR